MLQFPAHISRESQNSAHCRLSLPLLLPIHYATPPSCPCQHSHAGNPAVLPRLFGSNI
mgnify:CR=1 FL=1